MRKLTNWLRTTEWKKLMGYGALFMALFFLFLYLTFPFDAIRDTLINKIEAQGNLAVNIDEISTFRLSGFQIKGLKLAHAETPNQVLFSLDEARMRLRLLQLLRGRLWVDFDVYTYDGGIAGSVCKRGQLVDVAMNFSGLKLAKYQTRDLVRKVGQMDLEGVLSGNFEAHVNRINRRLNEGALNINLDNLKAKNIKILEKELPPIAFEPGKMSFELKRQNLTVKDFTLKGDNLEVGLTGRVTTREDLMSSRMFLTLKIKPSEAMEDALGIIMMTLKEPDANGFYQIPLKGTLKNPNAKP
ncbi:MAG TPA: type II secretion system protein GspN [bacterium]|nr:type II secretion system protein GspN [bacterium]